MKGIKIDKSINIYKLIVVFMCTFALFVSNIPANAFSVYAEEEPEEVVEEETVVEEEAPEEESTPEPTPTPEETPEVIEEEVEPEPTPEVTEEPEEIIEEPQEEIEEEPIENEDIDTSSYPSFYETKTIDDMAITVQADEGVFPGNTHLVVEKVPTKKEEKVTEAIDAVRDEEKNVAVSYSFDIRIEDENGNEVQPADQNKVKVSFALIENTNENLDTNVYHVSEAMKVEQLDVEVKDDTATVETTGFSIYTVEFTYDNKEYVLDGGDFIKFQDILDFLELVGEVESYEVSDPSLFDVVLGDENGVEYVENYDEFSNLEEYYPIDKTDGDTLYLVSLQPFTTEEWLKVTIDGIEYEIVVTDAIRVDENGDQIDSTVRYMGATGSATTGTNNAITDSRVIQGPTEDNFTASMPLAEIYINDVLVNMNLWKNGDTQTEVTPGVDVIAELLVDNTQGKYQALKLNTNISDNNANLNRLYQNYGGLYYDFSVKGLNGTADNKYPLLTASGSSANNYELFPGDIVKYTLKGMAKKFDEVSNTYKDYDVIITYSDILITLCNNSDAGTVYQSSQSTKKLNLIDTNCVAVFWDNATNAHRAGISYNVNVKVVDPDTGELVDGSYYYPMVDIDVGRTGVGGYANLYQAGSNNRYSEQLALMNNYGRPTSTGAWEQKIWIPGGNWSQRPVTAMRNITDEAFPYTAKITSVTIDGQHDTLLIQPGGSTGSVTAPISNARFGTSGAQTGDKHPQSHDKSFYSGFITLANNTEGGINIKGWGSASSGGGLESYVLTGSRPVNHRVDASSNVGGTIYTTTTGNHDGTLSGGVLMGNSFINEPHEISAATGQSVTYTMTPKGGYKLKGVYVKDGDIDIMTIVEGARNTVDESSFDTDGDGQLDENERSAYEAAVENAINTALSNDPNTSSISIDSLTSLGHGVYVYTFSGIQEDKSIHIEWEKTELTVTKQIDPSDPSVTDKFRFQIKLSDTSTHEATWRVRAKKNAYDFNYNESIENGTPYYMAYHEVKTETVPYKYVQINDPEAVDPEIPENVNPQALGWYEYINGAYVLSRDTSITPGVDYYFRDDEQTSTITNYYYHILGWNSETGRWDDYVVPAMNSVSAGASLDMASLDLVLPDNYRFIYDGQYVYNLSNYNPESETNDYLIFVKPEGEGSTSIRELTIGKSEDYASGNYEVFDPTRTDRFFAYVCKENASDNKGKVRMFYWNAPSTIDGDSYSPISVKARFENVVDTMNPFSYDLENNPNGYTLDQGYSKVEGETGLYIITLPAGVTPNTNDLVAAGWEVTVSQVGVIEDEFDLDQAMADAGAISVPGAVNTYEFLLGAGETIDFDGVVPMGWNYEITEILDPNSKWELVSTSPNATINDFDGEEHVNFTNSEKKTDVTIEKETENNVEGTFGFTIEIFKENITPGQSQSITLQVFKNASDQDPTYILTNSGNPLEVTINNSQVTIPTGETTYGSGGAIDSFIEHLLSMNNENNTAITINGDDGELSTAITSSLNDQIQGFIDADITSFSLEPVSFTLATPSTTNRIGYNPATLPDGFSGSDGVFTFELTNGGTKTFTGIPYGYKYEIKETGIPDGWENVSKTYDTGALTGDDEVTSHWVNKIATPDLKVEKETVDNKPGTFDFYIRVWKEQQEEQFAPEDIITIATEQEFLDLISQSDTEDFDGKLIKLDSDITITGTYSGHNSFTFNKNSNIPFKGTFDGQGHTISGLNHNSTIQYETCTGLFGYTNGAKIKNLVIDNAHIEADSLGGAVVGRALNTTLDNVIVKNSFISTKPADNVITLITDGGMVAGGLVGILENSVMYNCTADNIYVVTNATQAVGALGGKGLYLGALVGESKGSTIEFSRAINGTRVNNHYDVAVGAIGGVSVYAGGIVGELKAGSKVIDSFSTADLEFYCATYVSVGAGNSGHIGGIAGAAYGTSDEIIRSHFHGTAKSTQVNAILVIPVIQRNVNLYGLVDKNDGVTTEHSYYLTNSDISGPVGDGNVTDDSGARDANDFADQSYFAGKGYDFNGTTTRNTAYSPAHVNTWMMGGSNYPIHDTAPKPAQPIYYDLSGVDGVEATGNEGEYRFTLTNGQSITFPDLPYGYKYAITESPVQNWTNISSTNPNGILNGDKTSKFVNEFNAYDLTIIKEAYGITNGIFNFKIKVWNGSDVMDLSGIPGMLPTGVNGEYTFRIMRNDCPISITIPDIPAGYQYEIHELDEAGNIVQVDGDVGEGWHLRAATNTSGTITSDVTSRFENELEQHSIKIIKNVVFNETGIFNFKVKAWKTFGDAYAEFDSDNGTLTFFRDDPGKYTNGQTDGTKTYYTGIESFDSNWSAPASIRNSISTIEFKDIIQPKHELEIFKDCRNLTQIIGLDKLDTTHINSMEGAFKNCSSLTSLDLSNFDTRDAVSMESMFENCSSLTSLDLSSFDTSSIYTMEAMFSGCSNLTSLNLSSFDTSAVWYMEYMFSGCTNLRSLDLSSFDTSNVDNAMNHMFQGCKNIQAVLNIAGIPSSDLDWWFRFNEMFRNAATEPGSSIVLKYISPVTSADIDAIIAATSNVSPNVTNGGQGIITPPTPGGPAYRNRLDDLDYIYLDLNESCGLDGPDDNGYYTFVLRQDDLTEIGPIPYGFRYEIYEETKNNFELVSIDGKDPDPEVCGEGIAGGIRGVVTNDDITHRFLNGATDRDLYIYKNVSGSMGDKSKRFEFTVEFWRGDYDFGIPYHPRHIDGEDVERFDDYYVFTLSHGEGIVFSEIPSDVQFRIVEKDYSDEGYTTLVNRISGREFSGQMLTPIDVTFENIKDGAIPTKASSGIYIPFVGLSLLVVVLWFLLRRHRERESMDMK